MALSDFYDFAPLMAQLQQQAGGMSGGMGVPQNTWQGTQFVMPPVTPPTPIRPLPPYQGTAAQLNSPASAAPAPQMPGGLMGPVLTRTGRMARMPRQQYGMTNGIGPFGGAMRGILG